MRSLGRSFQSIAALSTFQSSLRHLLPSPAEKMSDGRRQTALTPVRNSHFRSRHSFCGENGLVLVVIRELSFLQQKTTQIDTARRTEAPSIYRISNLFTMWDFSKLKFEAARGFLSMSAPPASEFRTTPGGASSTTKLRCSCHRRLVGYPPSYDSLPVLP